MIEIERPFYIVTHQVQTELSKQINNCVYGSSPVYLQDFISKYNSGRQGLRSNRDHTRLAIPKTKRAFGDKSIAVFGPKLWNNLPANLREASSVQCFKKLLKTYLFPKSRLFFINAAACKNFVLFFMIFLILWFKYQFLDMVLLFEVTYVNIYVFSCFYI